MPYPTSARWKEAIRRSHRAIVRAQVLTTIQFGPAPTGGLALPLLGGDVTLASRSDIKGTLDITVPGELWELVQPYGAEIHVARGIDYGDGEQELVPLGYYRIEEPEQPDAPHGPITIKGVDRIAQLRDSRLPYPYAYPAGTTHRQLAERLINGYAPGGVIVTYGMYGTQGITVPIRWTSYDPDAATLPAGVVEDDPYEHLAKIFDGRSCVLRPDRHGELVVEPRDRPPGSPISWTVRPGDDGNMIKASRKTTRKGVFNMVVARGSDPTQPTGYRLAYNADPTSPLRWWGPFGVVPRYYASPQLRTPDQADAAAETVRARYNGLPTGTSVATVPDPSVDPLDPGAVELAPGFLAAQVHVADEVTIPLAIADAGPVEITCRTLNEIPSTGEEGSSGGEFPNPVPDPGSDPDPGSGGTGTTMAQILRLGPTTGWNRCKIGIGFAPGDAPDGTAAAKHIDYGLTQIFNGLSIPNYCEVVTPGRVRMSSPLNGGRTSSNTKYPRTELREMELDGTTLASWDSRQAGRRYIVLRDLRILRMPPNKPQLCVLQIHGPDDDIAMIRLDSKTLVNARYGDSEIVGSLTSSLVFETPYDLMLEVVTASNNAATCQINYYWGPAGDLPSTPTRTKTAATGSGWYFKGGCYAQSWGSTDPSETRDGSGPTDDIEDGPVVIEVGGLEIWRTGYPPPASTTDPGGDPGGDPGTDPGAGGPSPVPAGAAEIFTGDFANGLSGWSTVQNRFHNGSSSGWGLNQYPLTIVNDGAGHETAARFEIRSGDVPNFGGGERTEVRFPDSCDVGSGATRWYEFDAKFLAGFQGVSPSQGWMIMLQWHAGSGSPPLALEVREDETLRLRVNRTSYHTICPIDAGTWHRYTMKVTFGGSGQHEVWRDGQKLLTVGGNNMASGSNYMKLGIYRDSESFTNVWLVDRFKVWSG